MKNFASKLIILLIILTFGQVGFSQNGIVEADDGIIIGNNEGTTDGTIRYTGSDFEARKAGVWTSITASGSPMWSQNGSDVYYDTGNVGVGINNPAVEFHVEGLNEVLRISGTSPWMGIYETGGSNYGYNWMSNANLNIGVTGSNDIIFNTNSAARLRIKADGNVGIGTSSPGSKLDVRGSAIFNETGLDVDFRVEGDDDSNLFFVDGGQDLIGIGTGSPLAKMHIVEDDEAIRLDGTTPFLSFYDGATFKGYMYHNGTNMSLSNEESGDLLLRTNSSTRMTIDDSGNVGIGTTSPGAKLDVRGDVIFNEGSQEFDFRVESNLETHMIFVDASQNFVGINNDSPAYPLDVDGKLGLGSSEYIEDGGTDEIAFNGDVRPRWSGIYNLGSPQHKWVDIWATNGTIQTSDRNLKKDIEELPYGLKEVMKLKPVRFRWSEGNNPDFKLGLIAQEVLPVISEVVKTHVYEVSELDGTTISKVDLENMGIYYSDIIPVLIKGMQDQQNIINNLENRIEDLENK